MNSDWGRRLVGFFRKHSFLFLALAVFFVLAFPDLEGKSTYATHELYRDIAVVQSMYDGEIILQGPPSMFGGFHFGPAYYYLLYPFVVATGFKVFSLALASLIFFLATIVFSYIVVKEWWGDKTLALAAVFIMATSMFTIQFARYGSNPNFIPFFALLFFWALKRILEEKSNFKHWIVLALGFAVAVQLHAVPLVCLPIILLDVFLIQRPKINWRYFAVFILTALVLLSPYLYYEISHHFINAKSLLNIASGSGSPTGFMSRVASYFGFWLAPILSIHPFFDISFILGKKFFYFLSVFLVLFLPVV